MVGSGRRQGDTGRHEGNRLAGKAPVAGHSSLTRDDRDKHSSSAPSSDGRVGQVMAAIGELRPTGGLVVVEGGPGAGTTHTLAAVERQCQRTGWRLIDAQGPPSGDPRRPVLLTDGTPAPTDLVDDAVVVVTLTSGLAWAQDLAAAGARLLEESRLRVVRLGPRTPEAVDSILRADRSRPVRRAGGPARRSGGRQPLGGDPSRAPRPGS